MPLAERYPEAELVLDDELLYDEGQRRSAFVRRDERPEDIVREGEVLAGKYRVERIPGRSGLGVLVQVRHMELGQEVTLKFLVPEACAYPEFVQRFVREARSAVRIQGEHVARVTDVGRLESGAPYMVREFLRGPDLSEVLKVRGQLPVSEAVDYIVQACEGVAEGHALGVVHRNLRPTSLVVVRRSDGTALVKVFDFAAAESLHVNPFTERAVSLVGTSAIMASLPYLAPEQIRDPHDVDFRADVYSLGAILYELLTGAAVYAADAAPALLAQVVADAAPAVRNLRPDVPGELDHIVLRCLAKNRGIRYQSVAELVLALQPFASDEATTSIERIVRLGKRTSKLPELPESRVLPPLPPAPPPTFQPVQPKRVTIHDDVTTIGPYAGSAAPVVISPEPPRSERQTPQPPPLRSSVPPPLRASAPPPLGSELRVASAPSSVPPPVSELPAARPDTTSLPPPRSSMSGLTRSWAVPEAASAPLFTQRRLIAIGVVVAMATLGAVLAVRGLRSTGVAAAVQPPVAAPARVEAPPPTPAPAAPSVAAAPLASAASSAPALVRAAGGAVPAVAQRPSPTPAPVARRTGPKPRQQAPTETAARKPAAVEQEVATSRPAAGADLFDDMR